MADALDLSAATRRLVRTADGLLDEQYAEASELPGWTRAHVLAHLALNAEGLAGALRGVVEGLRVPMYATDRARDDDIDALAAQRPSTIRSRLLGSATSLSEAIAAVPDDESDATIERTPGGGRTFLVRDVPRMRICEVEIHHVDLAAGYDHTEWPPAFAALVLDIALVRAGGAQPLTARATDLAREWSFGQGGPVVSGRAVDLAWWLTGRGPGDGLTGDLPEIGGW